ncbi:hypothetical protein B296_00045009 [Ensete ventricosum]|uniref:DNA2/NAM7 helicase helicase domain-containing protein n=1 Tax=Ensete ventricosum TaxID=4639 RepID=A0A426Z8V9_ENSVE|nr:hypothetical protein B296_00045009 [Ensete ventricosum]
MSPRSFSPRGEKESPIDDLSPASDERCGELVKIHRYCHWKNASPWLSGANPRDLIMPVDGDDGFYPTGNELKPEIVNSNRKYRVHVLVCAPSNSALDEIVLRLLHTGEKFYLCTCYSVQFFFLFPQVEPATLVPLVHGCRQVFLVGDPVQLPATVISSTAEHFG